MANNPTTAGGSGKAAGKPAGARPGARPVPGPRTAAPPKPGPTLPRPAAPGAGVEGTASSGSAASSSTARAAAPAGGVSPPRPAAKPAMGHRLSAKRLRELHEKTARALEMPELTINVEESEELHETFQVFGDLTGFKPSGTLWAWLGIIGTFLFIYGPKIAESAQRRRARAAAAGPAQIPAQQGPFTPPPPPAAVISPMAPRPAAPAGAPAPPPIIPPGGTISQAAESLLAMNRGRVNGGLTPDVPGVPRTTDEERLGPV